MKFRAPMSETVKNILGDDDNAAKLTSALRSKDKVVEIEGKVYRIRRLKFPKNVSAHNKG